MNTISTLIDLLIVHRIALPAQIIGCSNDDITKLESTVGLKLPIVYKQFLKEMGQGAGEFLAGTDLFMPKLLDLRSWAESLLVRTNATFQLPPNCFVFLFHQGYQFMYFIVDQCDDPVVYLYEEQDLKPQIVYSSFTQWLAATIQYEIAGL